MHWLLPQLLKTSGANRREEILKTILALRGLTDSQEVDRFLKPPSPLLLKLADVSIVSQSLDEVVSRLQSAIKSHTPILIYGDYDADGVSATAILWSVLNHLGAKVHPFIPSRELHGYGLSIPGIQAALKSFKLKPPVLVITVDNGITAHAAAKYLSKEGIELIITDHHLPGESIPTHTGLVHTTQLSGAGIAWFLSRELLNRENLKPGFKEISKPGFDGTKDVFCRQLLDLTVIGTVADLMPQIGPNRSLVKFGLDVVSHTTRPGLLALMAEAGLSPANLTTYHLGYMIAPRINAMGRLADGMDSLRLLLTTKPERARVLAQKLGDTNRERQDLTLLNLTQAKALVGKHPKKIIVIDHQEFHEGIIGLVAGKLTETYYRPSIVISRKDKISKASARSVSGINIIELIRTFPDYLLSAGGHPLAAGFTLETGKIETFREVIETHAEVNISEDLLTPTLKIDSDLQFTDIGEELYQTLETLKPFGLGNPQPVFCTSNLHIVDSRVVGKEGKHLKLSVRDDSGITFPAIGFNLGDRRPELQALPPDAKVSLAYTIDMNTWNHHSSLQLQVKDIKL